MNKSKFCGQFFFLEVSDNLYDALKWSLLRDREVNHTAVTGGNKKTHTRRQIGNTTSLPSAKKGTPQIGGKGVIPDRWRHAAYCDPKNKVPLGFVEGFNNKIRVIQRRAYGLRDEEYLRLKILTCMLKEI